MTLRLRGFGLALLALPFGGSALANENALPTKHFSDDEIAAVTTPTLIFTETVEDVENYDKYFFFHREGTSFDEAYADLIECDSFAAFRKIYSQGQSAVTPAQYGVGGVIGGAIGGMLVDSIFRSATRRKIRRINMRNCMGYKGYQRYGLNKANWVTFNFEEGNDAAEPGQRQAALLSQARVASGPVPQTKVLEL